MRGWIILLLFCLNGASLAEEPFSVTVLKVEGPVYTKGQADFNWQLLKEKDVIAEDSLLQILDGGKIRIRYPKSSDTSKYFRLTLVEPMVLRLTPAMLRKIELSEVYLKKLPNTETWEEKNKLPLVAAWRRFTAVFDKVLSKLSTFLNGVDEMDQESIAQVGKPIHVLSPDEHQSVMLPELPGHLDVSWLAPEPGLSYQVFLWPTDEVKPKQEFSASQTTYRFDIYRSGQYFFKVQTSDQSYESRARIITVISNANGLARPKTADQSLKSTNMPFLEVKFPPDGALFATEEGEAEVLLSWRPLFQSGRYEVHVEKINSGKKEGIGETSIFRELNAPFYNLTLAAGSYRWWVNLVSKEGITFASEMRRFDISKKTNLPIEYIENIDFADFADTQVVVLPK